MKNKIINNNNKFNALKDLVNVLRENCPWDKEQTLSTLKRHTLEETYEVLEAIDAADSSGQWDSLKDELGDLLFQILFYTRIACEENAFTIDDVIDSLIAKMIYRHPHVFEDAQTDDVEAQWDQLKEAASEPSVSQMDDIPPLPSLLWAKKIQQRAARVGFDWNNPQDVISKVNEEFEELRVEIENNQHSLIEEEFGDILFSLVNLGRKLGLDAETALMRTNNKFIARFQTMEKCSEERGLDLKSLSLDEMENIYTEVKKKLEQK